MSTRVPAGTTSGEPAVSGPGAAVRPRLGFLGAGWIGCHRMEAVAESDRAEIVAVADPEMGEARDPESPAERVRAVAPGARRLASLEELLEIGDLDGLVIATPSALHARQAIRSLDRGLAVFCQKPLGRTAPETRRVVEAARRADLLLDVDFCYRETAAARALRDLVRRGELGEVFAVDLAFHNAYGPDAEWYHRPRLSGGGCVIDLGIHLVDLALWLLDGFGGSRAENLSGRLYAGGRRLADPPPDVEDYADVAFDLAGAAVRIACSWRLPAGRDAEIEVSVYGTGGGARLRNVDGSFYDFTAERFRGTSRSLLVEPPDAWGGRRLMAWVDRLAAGEGFRPEAEQATRVARVIDGIYGR